MQNNKKKLLAILDILKRTDEEHPVTANQIIRKLKLLGIDAERKSVLRDIRALIDYGYSIDLHSDNKLGFFLSNPVFEDWELKVLADAVLSARFLTQAEAENLVKKVYSQSSEAGEKKLRSLTPIIFEKSENRAVKINIDKIISAICGQRKVVFQYEFTDISLAKKLKRDGFCYSVSPFALYRRDDRYYIIANTDGYDNLSCYRLDRMKNLEATDLSARSAEEIVGSNPDMKISDHIRHTLYNFGGEKITLSLEIKESAIDDIIDQFGTDLRIDTDGDKVTVTVRTIESEGLYRWLLQFSGSVKAVSPQQVTAEMQKRITLAASAYGVTYS